MRLKTPAVALLLGVTSLSFSPGPLPSPARTYVKPRPLVSLARGLVWVYLLDHVKPENGRTWGSSLPEAAFHVGVKSAAGCFPRDELGCSWGPLQYPYCWGSRSRASATPLFPAQAVV